MIFLCLFLHGNHGAALFRPPQARAAQARKDLALAALGGTEGQGEARVEAGGALRAAGAAEARAGGLWEQRAVPPPARPSPSGVCRLELRRVTSQMARNRRNHQRSQRRTPASVQAWGTRRSIETSSM